MLKAISRSAFDLDTVLESLISTAVRLCNATRGGQIFHRHGDVYRYAASRMTVDPAYLQHEQTTEIMPGRGTLIGRVALENRAVQIADAWTDPEYAEKDEARVGNVRAMLGVPLMRNGEPVGAFALARDEPVPFTQRQLELVTTFADQAVIAIENARLFDEVQAKTRDLTEALQQQTATADVLKVISRSAFELDTVLKTLADSARSLSGATGVLVLLRDGEVARLRAESGCTPQHREYVAAHPFRPGMETVTGRVLITGEAVHIPDVLADPDYEYGVGPQVGNYRATFGAPLIRNGVVDGVFTLLRPEPGAFTPRQIELVRTFADQAVIAIENTRLFDEVQAKTRDLEESLQQQTATADVLKVISRSAFDLPAVLRTLVESAAKLCDADKATITREINGVYYRAETYGFSEEFMDQVRNIPVAPERGSISGRVMLEGKAVHVEDVEADPEYWPKNFATLGELRTGLGIPMMRNGAPIGVLALMRTEVRPFNAKQIELVQTFADQAVIAIENARLFDEVQAKTRDLTEALEQQTATAEVLKVISRSAFDLNLATSTILEAAAKLCRAPLATLHLRDGEVCRLATQFGLPEAFERQARENPIPIRYPLHSRRPARAGDLAHFSAWNDPDYLYKAGARLGGYRALVVIPLMREDELVGIFSLGRPEPEPFTPSQIKLVQTFADQAAIAIENSRLFNEVKARTEDLSEALQQQTATADVLKVISRSVFDLQTVLDTLVEFGLRTLRRRRSPSLSAQRRRIRVQGDCGRRRRRPPVQGPPDPGGPQHGCRARDQDRRGA